VTLWLLVGLGYLGAFHLVDQDADYLHRANGRFLDYILPSDNVLPLIFGLQLSEGADPRTGFFADWRSSDRPPLQTGVYLVQAPLQYLLPQGMAYQFLSIALQCTWVPGLWTL